MGKKTKQKGKGILKTIMKTEKKAAVKLRKEFALRGEEEIQVTLAKLVEKDKAQKPLVEPLDSVPPRRSSFSLVAHPDKDILIMFGGEYFDGKQTEVYNDLYFYNVKHDKWHQVVCPGGPSPRCTHQAVLLPQFGGQMWVFGGEFTSSSQSQFYHYNDLWVFHIKDNSWEKISADGGPSARSGHRMIALKKQLIVFGGFYDIGVDYRYYSDVYAFNLSTYMWQKLEVTGNSPSPRSGCMLAALPEGRVLVYGGYSKQKVKKDVDKGCTYSDMFIMSLDKHDATGLKWKWQHVKPQGAVPSTRCAFGTCLERNHAFLFGGVHDHKEDEEQMSSTFHNDLFQLDLARLAWHLVTVERKTAAEDKAKRRRRKENADTEVQNDNELDADLLDDAVKNVDIVSIGPSSSSLSAPAEGKSHSNSQTEPPARMNPCLVVHKGVLYVFGGIYEVGNRQIMMNDFYSLDLNRRDKWNVIKSHSEDGIDWFDSDLESVSGSDSDRSDSNGSDVDSYEEMDVDS